MQNTIGLGGSGEPAKGGEGKRQDYFYGVGKGGLAEQGVYSGDFQQPTQEHFDWERKKGDVLQHGGKDGKQHHIAADFQEEQS